jgi:hypothetical protein
MSCAKEEDKTTINQNNNKGMREFLSVDYNPEYYPV